MATDKPGRVQVRVEDEQDIPAVYELNAAAFLTDAEARLVDALRLAAPGYLSLVAEDAGAVVGHILFTPVSIDSNAELRIMGLAPMAVAPDRQRGGIGSALVRAGLDACRELGTGAVVVLGHAGYYPRFGFRPASSLGLDSEYDVPDDVFMALEFEPGYLQGHSGTVKYHAAFAEI